jgi:hypothetical protein
MLMPELELFLLLIALAGFFLGVWSVNWARKNYGERRAWWGRRLFIGTLLLLGATIFVGAIARAEGLVPVSLLASVLLIAMLWENPVGLQEESVRAGGS